MFSEKAFKQTLIITILLAFVVITLGAYVRLSDAGLGCPDWPGCYGKIIVPVESAEVTDANQAFPDRPVEAGKAQKEMSHRYAAGTLGLLVLILFLIACKRRKKYGISITLPLILLALIVFQALLGMWTVTLQLKPVIVMGHLLGGMAVFLLLSWLLCGSLNLSDGANNQQRNKLFPYALLGLIVVYGQILLGGWTSANYAALVCPDFPTCRGEWLPPMDFKNGFTFWTGLGKNYEYGLLEADARTAIHMTHRLGALITFCVVLLVSLKAMLTSDTVLRLFGKVVLVLLIIQLVLGFLNIKLVLPIAIAVAHNGVAALLLISVGALLYCSASVVFDRETNSE